MTCEVLLFCSSHSSSLLCVVVSIRQLYNTLLFPPYRAHLRAPRINHRIYNVNGRLQREPTETNPYLGRIIVL